MDSLAVLLVVALPLGGIAIGVAVACLVDWLKDDQQ